VLGLLVNLASAALLSHDHDHDHDHDHGHEHHDHNLHAAYIHVLADALTSVLAIVALLSGRYLGWVWMDPVMGIVGALVISRWSWTLMRQTATVLLDTANERLTRQLKTKVEANGDATVVDLHVWRIGPGAHAAIISTAGKATADLVRARVSSVAGIAHLTVESAHR
jgi:cation diffusion facilitator family transporter